MNATDTLARLIAASDAAALPGWTYHEAQRTLINMLAVSLSASDAPPVRAITSWAAAEGSAGGATVIGSGLRASATNAAMVNGYMAHIQDYDDTHFPTVLHPTAPVWPAPARPPSTLPSETGTTGPAPGCDPGSPHKREPVRHWRSGPAGGPGS